MIEFCIYNENLRKTLRREARNMTNIFNRSNMTDIFNKWNLRIHPFCPENDREGKPFKTKFLLKPLKPQKDERLSRFYFDHYNWDKSTIIQRISKDKKNKIFDKFPDVNDLENNSSTMVLITGSDSEDNTGRESLNNLILHKIQKELEKFQIKPLIVEVELLSKKQEENITTIAELFMAIYEDEEPEEKEKIKKLKKDYDKYKNKSINLSTFFQLWKRDLRNYEKPIVLAVKKTVDSQDLWQEIHNQASDIFKFIVIIVTNEEYIDVCFNLLQKYIDNLALIKAQKLELEETRTYLMEILAQERVGNDRIPNQLFPFSEEALIALYKSGSTYIEGEIKSLSIGRLNKIFIATIDNKLEKLLEKLNKGQDLTQDDLTIAEEDIFDASDEINKGGRR